MDKHLDFDATQLSPDELDTIYPLSPSKRASFAVPSLPKSGSPELRAHLRSLLLPYELTIHAVDRELAFIHKKLGRLRVNKKGEPAPVERTEHGGYRNHFWDAQHLELRYAEYRLFKLATLGGTHKETIDYYLKHFSEYRFEEGLVPRERHTNRGLARRRTSRRQIKERQWSSKINNINADVKTYAINSLLARERRKTHALVGLARKRGLINGKQAREIGENNSRAKQLENLEKMGDKERREYLASMYRKVIQEDLRRAEERRESGEAGTQEGDEEELLDIDVEPVDEMMVDEAEERMEQEPSAMEPPEPLSP